MGEVIVITSGKGGVGKSVAAVNISVSLAALGKKTILLDMDLGLRCLDLLVGLENAIYHNLMDLVDDRCTPEQVMITDEKHPGLSLIPASQLADKAAMTPEQMRDILGKLKMLCDYVIVDCPSGIEQGFHLAIAGADKALLVTIPENPAVRDADKAKELLIRSGVMDLQVLLNRVQPELTMSGVQLKAEQIEEVLGLIFAGQIPEDAKVIQSVNTGVPVVDLDSPAGTAFQNAAKAICGIVSQPVENEPRKRRFRRKKS